MCILTKYKLKSISLSVVQSIKCLIRLHYVTNWSLWTHLVNNLKINAFKTDILFCKNNQILINLKTCIYYIYIYVYGSKLRDV